MVILVSLRDVMNLKRFLVCECNEHIDSEMSFFFAIPLQQGEHELKYEQAASLILGVTCMTSRSQVGWELWIDQLPGFVGILQGTRGTCVEPARLGCFDVFNLILDGGGRVLIPCCQGVQGLKRSCTTGAWPSSSLLGWIGWMFSRFCSVSLHYGSWVYFLYNIRNMQYAIYLDIDLFTFLRCVSSRRPLEEIPLKATKDSCQKSLETTLGSDLVPSMPDWTSGGLAVWIGWRVTGEEESFLVQIRDWSMSKILANQNDQSKKCLFETNLDVRPAFFHEPFPWFRTRPRPRSVQLKHRNTRKCNYKWKQITRIYFSNCGLQKTIDICWKHDSSYSYDYHRSLLFPHTCRYWLMLRTPDSHTNVRRFVKHSLGSRWFRGQRVAKIGSFDRPWPWSSSSWGLA